MTSGARIGAAHSVVFAGFSIFGFFPLIRLGADALASRIQDAQCKVIVACDASKRGQKTVHLKKAVDEAVRSCPTIEVLLLFLLITDCFAFKSCRIRNQF